MVSPHPVHQQAHLWLSNKQSILSGECNHATITQTLQAFSKQNQLMQYRELGIESKMQLNNAKRTILPGFEISLPISQEVQALLERCLQGQKNLFPFPVTMRFQRGGDGGMTLVIRTKQSPGLEEHPHTPYAAGLNLEQFAKYQVFKGIATYIALNAVYQFEPDPKWGPVPPSRDTSIDTQPIAALRDTQRTYLSHRKNIDDLLHSHLTTPDIQQIRAAFKDAVIHQPAALSATMRPTQLPPTPIKPVMTKDADAPDAPSRMQYRKTT